MTKSWMPLASRRKSGEAMGIIQRDLEQRISEKADEIAEQRYGRDFGDLPASLQMQVWMEAEEIVKDKMADECDAIYDRMKEEKLFIGGNGHKPKEDREAHWAELELQRRLGK